MSKFEYGKTYIAENGNKYGPMSDEFDDCLSDGVGCWNFDGTPYFPKASDSPKLIEEWSDTMTPTAPT